MSNGDVVTLSLPENLCLCISISLRGFLVAVSVHVFLYLFLFWVGLRVGLGRELFVKGGEKEGFNNLYWATVAYMSQTWNVGILWIVFFSPRT